MPDDSDIGSAGRMMQWALENPKDWDVVLGFDMACTERTLEIQTKLREAGFAELSEMMAMRAYRLLAQNGESGS